MSKFIEIVDRPWVDLTLLAESIPHLLHWDLAYLWVLEKERDVRPDTWKERVEAWKYLLAQLLMDQLVIEEVPIKEPLIDYTRPFGLETVSWLRINGIKEAVGVLSPVVLVRPLPDYPLPDSQRNLLKEWQAALPDPGSRHRGDLDHLVNLAVANLKEQPKDSFAGRLAGCLEREFNPQPARESSARSVQYTFLDRLGWTSQRLGANVKNIGIFVKAEGDRALLWKPYCQTQGCLHLLARAEGDPPVDVQSDVITLTCSSCGFENKLPLTDFLVWFREEKQVVAWRRDGIMSSPKKGFPPIPRIIGNQLEFEWDAGQLRGERTKRFLKLLFPDRIVEERSISEISYQKIIVPGELSTDYKGLPFRNDWLAAIANIETVSGEVDTHLEQVTYRNVKINGLPVDVDIRFSNITIESNPRIHVGIYPAPHQMPPGWKNYRAFVAGSHREKHVIKGAGSRPILPWLAHFESGRPSAFSVETKDGRNGVTFFNALPPEAQSGPVHRINVGIDFGTSNTLVYVAPRDSDQTNITDKSFAIKPARLSENVSWFSKPEPVSQSPIADFLPSASRGQSAVDPYLIPTAVWIGINGVLLRWDAEPPIDGMRENGDFKSNDPATPSLRLAYLRELMFLTLPQMIRQADVMNWTVKLNLGFAFPLAFGSDARDQMKDILDDLKKELQSAGCRADCFTISESRACVKAFGSPKPNRHFLVADMGGGTLDLALFTTRGNDEEPIMHQIGSLRYAGEHYVKALADSVHEGVWKIRDSISSGDSWRDYGGNPGAAKTLDRFLAFAFEYMRTMVLAFRQTHENAGISLVLVGNGWHLADALSAGRIHQKARPLFEGVYKHLVAQLGISNLELYLKEPLTELQSSKHLVVIGALQNSWDGQGRRDLDLDEAELPKLPSGRAMELGSDDGEKKRFEWHDLVGDGIALEEKYSLGDLRADSEFFVHEMPPMSDSWRKHLLEQFKRKDIQEIPYPTEEQIRVQIETSIQGTPPKVGKGPLQIILEQSWVRKLMP